MYKKTEIRDYIWVIPLVAGIFAIIAILSPTAFYDGGSWDWWMWDLTTMVDNSTSLFILEFIILLTITTSAVLLSAVNLVILSIRTKKRNLNTKDFELMSIISAVLLISVMIYYIITMDLAFYDRLPIMSSIWEGDRFWDVFHPGFGIFLPFISAALSFIGIGVSRHYSKRKEDVVPPKIDIYNSMY